MTDGARLCLEYWRQRFEAGMPINLEFLLNSLNRFQIHAELKAVLCGMPYREFLETRYWVAIREAKIAELGELACERCHISEGQIFMARGRQSGGPWKLQIHHRTYQHRGEEYAHLEDLEVLCAKCHKQRHVGGMRSVKEILENKSA